MRAIVCGACGRMGRVLRQMINEALDWTLAAGVDPYGQAPEVLPSLELCPEADVIIDFSHHSGTNALLAYAVEHALPVVIATTGHTPEELAAIAEAAKKIPVFRSGNMSVGVALLCSLAKKTAAVFPEADIEIVETHHNRKLDVPSGTALTLAQAVQSVRPGSRLVIGRHENGKRDVRDIGIHSLRMGNVVGVHEIHICTDTQTLTLRHEAHDRALFAEGALQAAQYLVTKAPGLYRVEDILPLE